MKEVFKYLDSRKTPLGIFLVWLVHLSGLIGILAGAVDWFVPKTPLNLLISTGLFLWIFPLNTLKKTGLFALITIGGITAEWIGVHTGYLFGSYSYGPHLGPKLDGIPYLIGVNWALLSMASGCVSAYWNLSKMGRILIAGLLMVGLDFFMEKLAPEMDFWTFEGGTPPVWNYICWFLLALCFQWAYQRLEIRGNRKFSLHLLSAQFLFFIVLYQFYPGLP